MMKNRNLKILAGLAAGAALGYWLNSDEGRKMRSKARKVTQETYDRALENAAEKLDQAKSSLGSVVQQGFEITQNVLHTLNSEADERLDTFQESVDKGAQKAKRQVHQINQKLSEELIDA